MSNFECHYECLKVTRDAPAEVIRAAYRSLSQKHHPDKNVGDHEAARIMARLNHAYSVLSDAAQRELYDLQTLHRQRARDYAFHDAADIPQAPSGPAWLHRVRRYAAGRKGRIAAAVLGLLFVLAAITVRSVWKDQQSMLLLEQAALPAAGAQGSATPTVAAHVAATAEQPVTTAIPAPATPVVPAAAPDAQVAVTRSGEFERLTSLLKSMGLGLHKLDLPAQAPESKRPPAPAQTAAADKAAVATTSAAVPSSRPQAAVAAAPPEAGRPRDEAERPAAPDAAQGDTNRANVTQAPVANAASGAALRQAVIADARACAPSYPARAYSNGESGTVQLALLVGGDGAVIESKLQKSSGHAELDKAARKALSQCRFKVAANDRSVEPVWTNVEYAFSLD